MAKGKGNNTAGRKENKPAPKTKTVLRIVPRGRGFSRVWETRKTS